MMLNTISYYFIVMTNLYLHPISFLINNNTFSFIKIQNDLSPFISGIFIHHGLLTMPLDQKQITSL